MQLPRVKLTCSGDPNFLDERKAPSKPPSDYFLGAALVLYGLFIVSLIWSFGTMVNPELRGSEWWSAVTGSFDFRYGCILGLGVIIGGLRLLLRTPRIVTLDL